MEKYTIKGDYDVKKTVKFEIKVSKKVYDKIMLELSQATGSHSDDIFYKLENRTAKKNPDYIDESFSVEGYTY